MWRVEDIELVPVELDFSSSEQGKRAATAITSGGVRLFNAIELVEVERAITQVEVCEQCGYSHCAPGGWVAFRRIGQSVVWLPAWGEMEEGAREASEYRPPSFLATRGPPVFSPVCWERLRALHGGLPRCEDVPRIDSRETVRVCQWAAPGGLLGEYPAAPRVRRELVLGVGEGDLATELSAVDQCLRDHYAEVGPMELLPERAVVRPVELWLDLPRTPGWKGIARVDDGMGFTIDENAVLVRAG